MGSQHHVVIHLNDHIRNAPRHSAPELTWMYFSSIADASPSCNFQTCRRQGRTSCRAQNSPESLSGGSSRAQSKSVSVAAAVVYSKCPPLRYFCCFSPWVFRIPLQAVALIGCQLHFRPSFVQEVKSGEAFSCVLSPVELLDCRSRWWISNLQRLFGTFSGPEVFGWQLAMSGKFGTGMKRGFAVTHVEVTLGLIGIFGDPRNENHFKF